MWKLFSKRKAQWQPASPLPLSLGASQVARLKELVDSEAYEALQDVVQRLAEIRAVRLLKPGTPDEHNFDRGVLFAYREVYDVIERIVLATERLEAHERRSRRNGDGSDEGDGPISRLWGSPNFADEWQR